VSIYRTASVPTPAESYVIGVESGKRIEQERIIKLLEDEGLLKPSENYDQQIIALIKGEK